MQRLERKAGLIKLRAEIRFQLAQDWKKGIANKVIIDS